MRLTIPYQADVHGDSSAFTVKLQLLQSELKDQLIEHPLPDVAEITVTTQTHGLRHSPTANMIGRRQDGGMHAVIAGPAGERMSDFLLRMAAWAIMLEEHQDVKAAAWERLQSVRRAAGA
jgi:hypothetical protein